MSFPKILSAVTLLSCCLATTAALAQTTDSFEAYTSPEAVSWTAPPSMFPKGTQFSVLTGDPAKPGPFAIRVRMEPGVYIAPHTHNMDEMLTVISGDVQHLVGKTFKASRERDLKAGGFVHLPEGVPHSLKAGAEGAVIQVTGVGPFSMTYVNPADNPASINRH
ncbi:cupin domain-containing protein [Gluconobacter morbifer]|uniref:Cupin type-2 domain-containing protein n=1 Tax=Gluconobacter morbifer G707 TaxID=1088869 RepID=G6XK60_9PROT|nr:cupin domain-containing protein [Gluconobacter morbifer]EHH68022.1 hypothetical protein GMO_17890 [Gluconobacter morbifer G707]